VATRPLTLDEILIQLPATPERIAAFATGVAPAKLRKSSVPGEWSATEVLAHLRACADVWGNNIVRIIREDKPAWVAVNPRSWIEKTDYVDLEFAPSLRAFTKQRAGLMAELGPLPRKDWSRVAVVSGGAPTYERTVLYYAERLARHERAHVKQIGRIIKTLQT
jgi:DinB family protein